MNTDCFAGFYKDTATDQANEKTVTNNLTIGDAQVDPLPYGGGIDTPWDINLSVYGTVRNEFDEPMNRVHVYVQGKESNGTSTDEKGNFNLWVGMQDKLIISHLGYKTKTIKPNMVGSNNVTLELEHEELDEVVVNAPEKTKSYASAWLLAVLLAGGYAAHRYNQRKSKSKVGLGATKKKSKIVKVTI